MVATRSGANSAPAPAPEEPPLLDVTKQSGISRRRLNPARWFVRGAFGECISHQEEGHALTHSGTFLVFMEYVLFVALSLLGGFTAPVNISICGYMELLPDWVAFLYCHVAAAGIDSTLWHAAVKFKTEPHVPLRILQLILSLACAGTLTGFSVFPRCLWDYHQTCVLWWVYASTAAILIMSLRDRKHPEHTWMPFLLWALGTWACNVFYNESSMRFYAAEAVTVLAYVAWCSSVQRRHERKFTMTRVATVDAVAAGLILAAFRYNQRYSCKVTGKWR